MKKKILVSLAFIVVVVFGLFIWLGPFTAPKASLQTGKTKISLRAIKVDWNAPFGGQVASIAAPSDYFKNIPQDKRIHTVKSGQSVSFHVNSLRRPSQLLQIFSSKADGPQSQKIQGSFTAPSEPGTYYYANFCTWHNGNVAAYYFALKVK